MLRSESESLSWAWKPRRLIRLGWCIVFLVALGIVSAWAVGVVLAFARS